MAARAQGVSRSQVCLVFGIHRTTLRRWEVRHEQTGSVASSPRRGRVRLVGAAQEAALLTQLQGHPDATLEEHVRLWEQEQEQHLSRATMARALLRVKWTRKKSQ